MDRRLPARPDSVSFRSAIAAVTLCAGAFAMDPEARTVSLGGSAPVSAASDAWLPIVVCLLAAAIAAVALLRRARRLRARPASGIQLLDRTALSRGRALSLIRVGDRVVLVGESSQGFQRLAEFSAEDPGASDAVARRLAS